MASRVSAMALSLTSAQASSGNFFIGTSPELRPKKSELEAHRSHPLSRGLPCVLPSVAAVPAEEPHCECREATVNGAALAVHGSEGIVSREEISRHRSVDDAWIVVDGKVYDVTKFVEVHPGGGELILDFVLTEDGAKDAGPLMRGRLDEDGHSHSSAAFKMLEQFLVGSVEEVPADSGSTANAGKKKYCYDIDYKKPIVCQVGHLGADYDEWVHDPVMSKDPPRFFESDFLEVFTRAKWWVVPLVWIPVALAMICTAVVKENVPLSRLPVLCAGGIFVWSSMEYLLHRFLFHMKTSSFLGNTMHYVLHGFHHKHPMDGSRLVFPPLFAAPICLLIWMGLGDWGAAYPNKLVIYAVGLINYVIYDVAHYFLHFGNAFNHYSRQLKRYHLNHHFKDQTKGFGVTSPVWDIVFLTKPTGRPSIDR